MRLYLTQIIYSVFCLAVYKVSVVYNYLSLFFNLCIFFFVGRGVGSDGSAE